MAFVCRKMSLLEAGTAQSHRAGWLIAAAALSRARGRKSEDSISAAWLSETCLHGEETSHLLRLEPPLTNIPCTPFNEPTRGVKIHMAELTHPSSFFKSKDAMNWVQVLIELVESSYHPETTRVAMHQGTARTPPWARQGSVFCSSWDTASQAWEEHMRKG